MRLATERLAALRAERDGALRLAQAAQAEEAMTRAEGLTPGANPLLHYLTQGARAGLSPHPLFDPAGYRDGGRHHYLAVG
ncbi:MAG: hypothetical protein ACK53I_08125, partial [Phenylobacterium sp.]